MTNEINNILKWNNLNYTWAFWTNFSIFFNENLYNYACYIVFIFYIHKKHVEVVAEPHLGYKGGLPTPYSVGNFLNKVQFDAVPKYNRG